MFQKFSWIFSLQRLKVFKKEEKTEFINEMYLDDINRAKIIIPVITLLYIIALFFEQTPLYEQTTIPNSIYQYYFYIRLARTIFNITIYALLMFGLFFNKGKVSIFIKSVLYIGFAGTIIGSMGFAFAGQLLRGQIEAYINALLVLSFLFYIPFFPYIILFSIIHIVFMIGMVYLQPDIVVLSINIYNSTFAFLISLLFSRVLYHYRIKDYINHLIIENQLKKTVGIEAAVQIEKLRNLYDLSIREEEVALLVAEGLSNEIIASRLYISLSTVKTHIHHIFSKTGVKSRLELYNLIHSNSESIQK